MEEEENEEEIPEAVKKLLSRSRLLEDPLTQKIEGVGEGLKNWFNTYAKIIDARRKVISPTLNEMQEDVCEIIAWCLEYEVPIRIINLKPRQRGSSTITMAAVYWMIRRFGLSGMISGGKGEQAGNLWEMFKFYAENDDYNWRDRGPEGVLEQTTDVGASLAKLGKQGQLQKTSALAFDPGRSGTFQVVVLTEAARWQEGDVRNPDEVLAGMMNCMVWEPNTFGMLESTAKGPFGMFYERWRDSSLPFEEYKRRWEAGENLDGYYVQLFTPWFAFSDCRVELSEHQRNNLTNWLIGGEDNNLTAEQKAVALHCRTTWKEYGLELEQIAWYRQTLYGKCEGDVEKMKRDNPSSAAEAFHAAADRRFNAEGLGELIRESEEARFTRRFGNLEPVVDTQTGEGVRHHLDEAPAKRWTWVDAHDPNTALIIRYEEPKQHRRYLVTADPMSGKAEDEAGKNRDHHSVHVLRDGFWDDAGRWWPPKQVATLNYPCQYEIDVLAEYVWALSYYYGSEQVGAHIIPEINIDPGLTMLLKAWGANLFEAQTDQRGQGDVRTPKPSGKVGWQTTEKSRKILISELSKRIREVGEEGTGISVPDLQTVHELNVFIRNAKGRDEAAEGEHDDRVMALAIGLVNLGRATLRNPRPMVKRTPPEVARWETEHFEHQSRSVGGQYS